MNLQKLNSSPRKFTYLVLIDIFNILAVARALALYKSTMISRVENRDKHYPMY